MNIYSTMLQQKLENDMLDELGLEGFASFQDFLDTLSGKIDSLFKKIFNEDFRALDIKPEDVKDLDRKLRDYPFNSLGEVMVYRPDDLKVPMADHSAELVKQLSQSLDVIDRLYKPTIKWLAKAATQEDFYKKAWVDRELVLNPIDKMAKALGDQFDKRPARDQDPSMAKLFNVYGSEKQLDKSHLNLVKAYELGSEFDLVELKAKEQTLVRHINYFIEATEDPNKNIDVPKPTMSKLAGVIRAIAAETEYMVGLIHMTRVAISSYNDTLDVIQNYTKED